MKVQVSQRTISSFARRREPRRLRSRSLLFQIGRADLTTPLSLAEFPVILFHDEQGQGKIASGKWQQSGRSHIRLRTLIPGVGATRQGRGSRLRGNDGVSRYLICDSSGLQSTAGRGDEAKVRLKVFRTKAAPAATGRRTNFPGQLKSSGGQKRCIAHRRGPAAMKRCVVPSGAGTTAKFQSIPTVPFSRYSSLGGSPQPPPPGVRMLRMSPASTSRVSLPARWTSS